MIQLLVHRESPEEEPSTSFGGLPIRGVGEEFQWPTCGSCSRPMQFLGKLVVGEKIEQIFMCQNSPGLCAEWEANGGANAVVITTANQIESVTPPEGGVTTRGARHGAFVVDVEANDYEATRVPWAKENGLSPRQVLGKMFGKPSWLQADETPNCDTCQTPMRFVAQLEEGPDLKYEMNFGGGGCAYLFDCACDSSAKFLWQC